MGKIKYVQRQLKQHNFKQHISFSRDLPNPGIEPRSPTLWADALPSEPPGKLKQHNGACNKCPVCVCVCTPMHVHARSVAQSCLTLCNPMECSPIHGIFQARILEWVAIPFSRRIFLTQGLNPALQAVFFTTEPPGKPLISVLLLLLSHFSHVWLCATP